VSSTYGDSSSSREVVPGTLRGYRGWRMDSRNGVLYACNWMDAWISGRNEASCKMANPPGCKCGDCNPAPSEPHAAPSGNCTCGFYGKHLPFDYDHRANVVGVIKAYGNVVLGTKGFRAQYAEIEALLPLSLYGGLVPEIWEASRDLYQVPVFEDHDSMLEQFPPISVKELLPEEESGVKDFSSYHSPGLSGTSFTVALPGANMTPEMWKMLQSLFPNGQTP
jgi:hypothetical protein